MPTITLNKKRVLTLVGNNLPDEELRDRISYLGTDLEDVNKDSIIVEVFPNRPDLLSEEGFARALSSFIGKRKGLRKYSVKKSNYIVNIKRAVHHVRPYTACAVIKNLKLDDDKIKDIINIQEKLHITYGRNRKRCAVGIYPMESIKWPITYTAKPPKEIKFVPLEETREMDGLQILSKHKAGREFGHLLEGLDEFPVFIDAKNEILSVPPIINSEKTGKISEKTKDVFLESSGFAFDVVLKEINIICAALADMGGELYEVKLNYEGPKKYVSPAVEPEKILLPIYYVEKYLGLKLKDEEIIDCLEKMGYSAQKAGHNIKVLVPFYRNDIIHPVDLVEDIAIGYGYDNIVEDNTRVYSTGKENYISKVKRKLREIASGLGLVEVNNYSLLNSKDQKIIYGSGEEVVRIKNSVSSEYDSLRLNIIPCMLGTLKNNKHNEYPQNIFESGTIFKKNNEVDTGVEENNSFALLLSSENTDFTKAKQHLDALFESMNLKYTIEKDEDYLFMPGRTGKILLDKEKIGMIGELNPEILSIFKLEIPVSGFEFDLNKVCSKLK